MPEIASTLLLLILWEKLVFVIVRQRGLALDVCAAVGAPLRDLGRPHVDRTLHLVCAQEVT